ncbi:MAG: GNAT family N-acetyltransferase [Firmicutes bacterium]|nr:GNAT family N-acetyltransferase [Bacillota bacterium]
MDARELEKTILARYDEIARAFARAARGNGSGEGDTRAAGSYEAGERCRSPQGEHPPAREGSGTLPGESGLGCARLADLVQLFPGETLLDLGSGPGLETIALARLVDPAPAYGLDALPSMVEVATENARRAGATNVTFITGTMEAVPLQDGAVDVVVSNCVINLSQDKERVAAEIWRVLRPGGRVAIADMVWLGAPPPWVRNAAQAWACCVGGALEAGQYPALLEKAGFVRVNARLLWTLDPTGLLAATAAPSSGPTQCCGPTPGPCHGPASAPGCGGTPAAAARACCDPAPAAAACCDPALGAGACCSPAPAQDQPLPPLAGALITARKPGTPGSQVSIREAGPSDLRLVERILEAARLPTAGVAEHLSSFLLACTPEGKVVGVAGLERYRSCALLRSLVVLPSWRGQGLGRRLVAAQIDRLTPATAVFLLTMNAQDYFRALGFRPVPRGEACAELAESPEFRGACPESATLMRLP